MKYLKALAYASSDEERANLALEFVRNCGEGEPVQNSLELIQLIRGKRVRRSRLARSPRRPRQQSGRGVGDAAVDANLLHTLSEIALALTTGRLRIRRHGFSIDITLDDGKIISSAGYALNEGVIDWLTRKMMPDLISKLIPDLPEGFEFKPDSYVLEAALADRLIVIFGEDIVTKAHFGDQDSYTNLKSEINSRFGKGAFLKIIELSDKGQWREAFRFIDSSERAAKEASDGTN
jgi:hypothetical protein